MSFPVTLYLVYLYNKLCSPGCPETHYVDQDSLKFLEIHLPLQTVIKDMAFNHVPPPPALSTLVLKTTLP